MNVPLYKPDRSLTMIFFPPKVLIVTGTKEARNLLHWGDWGNYLRFMPELVEATITYTNLQKTAPFHFPSSKLEKLDLSNNVINEIFPQPSNNIGNLRELNLSNNFLEDLHSYQFKSLTKLQVLDLSNNLLEKLNNKELDGLINLKELRLDGNKLHQLAGKSFSEMEKLAFLSVSHNKLKLLDELSDVFSKAPNLEMLDLSRNSLGLVFGRPFQNLTRLTHLYLNQNHLQKLGNESFRSMELEYLDLSENDLTSISAGAFFELKCRILKLNNNLLNTTELRSALSGVQDLKELDLSSNEFKSLPADLFTVLKDSPLERLSVSNNQLKELPKLPAFKTIKELDFSRNEITSISKSQNDIEFMQNFWPRLETRQLYIYLQNNELTCKPCDVEVLKLFESKNYKCKESDNYCLRCERPRMLFRRKIIDLPIDNSTSKDECVVLLGAIQDHHSTKGNFIYFLIILTMTFFVALVLLFVFRQKVFGSYMFNRFLTRKENKSTNISDLAKRKLVDEVQSNGNPSNNPDKEICLISFDPPKIAYSNGVIDATKQ